MFRTLPQLSDCFRIQICSTLTPLLLVERLQRFYTLDFQCVYPVACNGRGH